MKVELWNLNSLTGKGDAEFLTDDNKPVPMVDGIKANILRQLATKSKSGYVGSNELTFAIPDGGRIIRVHFVSGKVWGYEFVLKKSVSVVTPF